MTMKQHISSIVKSGWFYLRKLLKIRELLLSFEQTKILVHAFIISRLDINNCLLYGLPDKD